MTVETANHLLHFARHHLKQNGLIWFFGGEPFVALDIMKYVVESARAAPLSIRFGATTNLTLVTEEVAKWMKKNGFSILCSIDLSKERHNKYRVYPDGSGSWDDAWQGLENVRKHLIPVPQIRSTFAPGTIKGLADDIKSMVEQGLTNLATGAAYETKWTDHDFSELEDEFKKLRDYYGECYEERLPLFSMFVRDGIAATNKVRPWYSHCGLGQGSLGVDANGDLYPCHRFVVSRTVKIGNVEHGFTPERLHWIENWRKMPPYGEFPEKCIDCSFKTGCSGGCLAANWDLFGNVHVIPDAFCKIKHLCVEYFGDFRERYTGIEAFDRLFNKKFSVRE